jgi:hypothetical protein
MTFSNVSERKAMGKTEIKSRRQAKRQERYDAKMAIAAQIVPEGFYCYGKDGRCPYWKCNGKKPAKENGYCRLLKRGDWMRVQNGKLIGIGLLWDQVKECGIHDNDFYRHD